MYQLLMFINNFDLTIKVTEFGGMRTFSFNKENYNYFSYY